MKTAILFVVFSDEWVQAQLNDWENEQVIEISRGPVPNETILIEQGKTAFNLSIRLLVAGIGDQTDVVKPKLK